MPTADTGSEVLQMAMDLEQAGQTFYESLALGCDNRQVAMLCARLAKAEGKHYERFKALRARLCKGSAGVPIPEEQEEAALALAKSRVLPDPREVRKVGVGGKLKDALAMAIQMEKNAIDFYVKMRGVLPAADETTGAVIREEQGHLLALENLKL